MPQQPTSHLFPEGLGRWFGHRDGGVRRPFDQSSGRPTGKQIETPLVRRLALWAKSMAEGQAVPRSVLLVGGPGNGKTDAIEGVVVALDSCLNAGGELVARLEQQYNVSEAERPPRKVIVDTSEFPWSQPLGPDTRISLVQDATEGDPYGRKSAEESLLEELEELLAPNRRGVFLCCVNRGILARVASLAATRGSHSDTDRLLTTITNAVTSGPKSPQCWPLDGFEQVAVWPMDVESLVESPEPDRHPTVAHQIFTAALAEDKWKQPCDNATRCPFCRNRKLLTKKGALDALVRLLHYYELASGKRWTFRDLFSLVPYLLVGDFSELEVKGKRVPPCEWVAIQMRMARDGRPGSIERDRVPYLLMSRLYHHRLFPTWPRFDRGEHRLAKQELLREGHTDDGLNAAKAFFRFMAQAGDLTARASGDVPDRVRRSVGPVLDPALATEDDVLLPMGSDGFSVTDIEQAFSISVRDGLDRVGGQLEPLERDVLKLVSAADESLTEDRFPRNRTRQARLLQMTLRQYAARLVKRSLGCRLGACKNQRAYQQYLIALRSPNGLKGARKELGGLLHDHKNHFRAGLATTFGQPIADRSRDVVLLLSKKVTIEPVPPASGNGRPVSSLPYLKVDDYFQALTFDLFVALSEVGKGLHEGSLPSEIFSLLDRVKSLVSGSVIRDPQVLADEPTIVLGSSREQIEFTNDVFVFSRGNG
jgi:hypothetical protein